MREITQRLKLTNWKGFRDQVLRAFIAIKLGNNDSVSITESIATLWHRSAAAHKYYNKTSSASKCNKYKALGILKKK